MPIRVARAGHDADGQEHADAHRRQPRQPQPPQAFTSGVSTNDSSSAIAIG